MQKIFVDQTNIYAFKNMVKSINENESNIILVPDKFSLSSERLFFEENNLTVSFSTQTFSLTKLASLVLENKLRNQKLIDKNVSIMIISSIISQNFDKLKYFKNVKDINEFSVDIYNFVSQILTSNAIDFNQNVDKELKNKLDDVKFILKEYQKVLQNCLIDSSFKFEMFFDEIKNSDLIKNTNFYFGMFNSLTPQIKKIIKEIAKYAKSVTFSTSFVQNRVNNNEIYDFYLSLDKNCEVVKTFSLKNYNKFIVDNFFSASTKRFENNNYDIKIFEAKNIEDEVDNLLYEIRKDVLISGLRFKDIAICVNDFNAYGKLLKEKLEKLNFTYFVDENKNLIDFGYSRFIIDLLKCLNEFSVSGVLSLLKSGYIDIESKKVENFENFLYKFNLQTVVEKDKIVCFNFDENFSDYIFVLENYINKILETRQKIENLSVKEIFNEFNDLCEELKVKQKFSEKLESLKLVDIVLFKQYSQLEDKISKVFDQICEFNDKNLSIDKIIYFVTLCFENTAISLPPVVVDSIFVGDPINSYFDNYKKLYVLGMDSDFPMLTKDNALFLESEIKKIEKDEINPKPSLINKINFFKSFENLLCSTENLILSYSVTKQNSQNYPSIFLKNFYKFFTIENSPMKSLKINSESLGLLESNEILALLALKFSTKDDFIKNYYLCEDENLKKVLRNIIDKKISWDFNEKEIFVDKSLINIDKFSSSSVEDYFACPRKFFYRDVLKLKPNEKVDFDSKITGILVHECCKELGDKLKQNDFFDEKSKESIINSVFLQKKYSFLHSTINGKTKILNLKKEILKLFDFIINQQIESEFKVSKTEFAFLESVDDIKFKGFVDRIDENKDEFIIIDYKTGSTKIDYGEIVLCKKVQLLLYAKILEQKLNKKCMGVFYLTVSDDYSASSKQKIFLNGIVVNENNMKNKLGNEKFFVSLDKFLLTRKQFEKLINFVFDKIKSAINQIKNANFCETPLESENFCECDYCDYSEICAKKEKKVIEFDESMLKEILDD